MILDNNLLFDTLSTVWATTRPSTNVIDLANARDIGTGDAEQATPKVMVLVTTAFVASESGTLQVQCQGSTDNSNWSTYAESPAIAEAALTAGTRLLDIDWPRPGPGMALPRYLRLNYVVGASGFSAGALTAALVLGRQDAPPLGAYPSGVVVNN